MFLNREMLNITGGILAIVLAAALAFLLYALVYVEVPDKNQNALLIVIGILSTNITSIVGFFFGSSVGSKKQQDTISTLVEKAPVPKSAQTDVKVGVGDHVKVTGVENAQH